MTADAPGRVGRRTGSTGSFRTGSHKAARQAAPRDFGPFDAEDLDPAVAPPPGLADFGSIRVPIPDGGTVTVEPTANGRLQAVHVTMPGGRLSVSALAAPKSSELWPDLVAEIDTSLRDGGARVRSFQGEWGRELHARTGTANSVFLGVDGARWMLYGVATGPAKYATGLEAALRTMLKGSVVDRGRSPYPVRTVLPLVVPEHLAGDDVVEDVPTSVPGPPAVSGTAEPQQVAAEATEALLAAPRDVAQARPLPVRVDRPRDRSPVDPPAPLWAASAGPVSAANLGPDPTDDVSAGRPANDVVTPTEWWPVIAAEPVAEPVGRWSPEPARDPEQAAEDRLPVEVEAPPTEWWPGVSAGGLPTSAASVDEYVPPTEWWPAVPGPAELEPRNGVDPAYGDPAYGDPAYGDTAYGESGYGQSLYAELQRDRSSSYAEPLESEPLDAEPLFAGLLEARRRPPVPDAEPVDRAAQGLGRTGRRRAAQAPAPAPSGGRRRAPDPVDQARRDDDTLDLAALVRERPGRRQARYEPEPVGRAGRRRALEPPGGGPVTAPLPAVAEPAMSRSRHGRGDSTEGGEWMHPAPGEGRAAEGPTPVYLAPPAPARSPGRHHRPI